MLPPSESAPSADGGLPALRALSARAVVRHPRGGRVLLLQRPPGKSRFPGRWEFPGGKPDPGEGFAETLLRETREETGLGIRLGAVLDVAEGEVDDKVVAYLFVEAACDHDQVTTDPGEHQGHLWIDYESLATMAATPEPDEEGAAPGAPRLVPDFRSFALDHARKHGFGPRTPSESDSETPHDDENTTLDGWVRQFKAVSPRYDRLGTVLVGLMKAHVKPLSPMAVIEGRTKKVASFAGKILRKSYGDPLLEMTDLYGLRVITQINSEVEAVCRFIRKAMIAPDGTITRGASEVTGARKLFVIDEKNSEDKLERLNRGEFGYRSVHFVVSLDRRAFPADADPDFQPEALGALKLEIQVRTQLQHAWADISHDRLYKGAFKPPPRFVRESARLAALLEDADGAFIRLVEGLDDYECHYGSYLESREIEKQIAVQRDVLKHDPANLVETLKLARLHLALETPEHNSHAEGAVLRIAEDRRTADLWCALGDALRLQGGDPAAQETVGARLAYEQALKLQPGHKGAMTGLALAAATSEDKLAAWAAACRANPGDPATLSGFIRQKIKVDEDASFLPLLRPSLLAAIEKCRLQVEVKVDLPWAYYRMAGFQLLLGEDGEWEAYGSLAKAIRCDAKPLFVMREALEALDDLLKADKDWPGAEPMRRMLLAALRVKCPEDPASAVLEDLASSDAPVPGPVVIVAGGCDPAHEERMAAYRALLEETFRGFRGTLLSGGTQQGIAGLVGGLAGKATAGEDGFGGIHAIGYLPALLPSNGTATRDLRYHDTRYTGGTKDFSVLEPLQNWIDLLSSGIRPEEVRVVGINGGRIAGFEYLLAWALGAKVALLRDSGRVADSFEAGIRDGDYPGMMVLPHDPMSVQAFLHSGVASAAALPDGARERLARYAHALFLEENRHRNNDQAMQPWEKLREDFQGSNLNQIDHMVRHLTARGYRIEPMQPGESVYEFGTEDEDDVEAMSRAEHGRWNVERIAQGWRYGPQRDTPNKIHHCLVPWEELDEQTRGWDRNAVRRYPAMLAEAGLVIRPTER